MCGGMEGCPLLAVLFIFSIFVEGNKSRVGECGAKDGLGALANRALVEGQQVMEVGQHFPTALCVPVTPSQNPPLPRPSWMGRVAVGLPPGALPHSLAQPSAWMQRDTPEQTTAFTKSCFSVSGLVPTRTRALPISIAKGSV